MSVRVVGKGRRRRVEVGERRGRDGSACHGRGEGGFFHGLAQLGTEGKNSKESALGKIGWNGGERKVAPCNPKEQ